MRPTISLCSILKNEVENLPKFLESFHGCLDEVHLTDTGSTDGSVEWIKEHAERVVGCKVYLHHFDWINDFAAARNYSFSHAKTDFICWADLDDCLKNREAFIHWRDHAMQFADGWYANYNYAIDENKNPVISFVRERVVRNDGSFKWQYFIHEGLLPQRPNLQFQIANTWAIDHHRTQEDFNKDRSRNLSMLEAKKADLPSRLLFYYGKELHDAGKPEQALQVLLDACVKPDLEAHDRVLGLQYAAYSAMQMAEMMQPQFQGEKYLLAEKLAKQGLELDHSRAEFFCIIGDAMVKRGMLPQAIPYFTAATACIRPQDLNPNAMTAIFNFKDAYVSYPKTQLCKIFFQMGRIDEAERLATELVKLGVPDGGAMLDEVKKAKVFIKGRDYARDKTEEIVFTCPPHNAYPFDDEIYKTKPLGGSETALCEMAQRLHRITGRKVIVFNPREENMVSSTGVEWRKVAELAEYFSKYEPKVHIAWRHTIKVTDAPTFIWCHDLQTQGAENHEAYDKHLCLTEFHKNYTMAMKGVPSDKIVVTRNGINLEKFPKELPAKNPLKCVFMSSPDRGLEYSMLVVDRMREMTGEAFELHVYYGFDNLYKFGMAEKADQLKKMASERPWVHLHGFTEQKKMYQEVADAAMWVHPATFIESYCVTALEMLELKIYPITRFYGALQNTLGEAEAKGHAVLVKNQHFNAEAIQEYADRALEVWRDKRWESIDIDMAKHDWHRVAEEWVKFLGLE